jgi:hypothetical protein
LQKQQQNTTTTPKYNNNLSLHIGSRLLVQFGVIRIGLNVYRIQVLCNLGYGSNCSAVYDTRLIACIEFNGVSDWGKRFA